MKRTVKPPPAPAAPALPAMPTPAGPVNPYVVACAWRGVDGPCLLPGAIGRASCRERVYDDV